MSAIIRLLHDSERREPPAAFQKMLMPLLYTPTPGKSPMQLLPNVENPVVDPEMTRPPGIDLPPGMTPFPQPKTYKPGELL